MQLTADLSLRHRDNITGIQTRSPLGSASVLIIDDDLDAILPIEHGFRLAGFSTACAIDIEDASQKVIAHPPDLIVLDWMLDYGSGRDVIRNCLRKMAAHFCPTRQIPVITHSGLDASAISIGENPIFKHIAHWKKPVSFSRVVESARALLNHPLVHHREDPSLGSDIVKSSR